MSLPQRVSLALGLAVLAAVAPLPVFGQSSDGPEGGEYTPGGVLPGDQINPQVSLSPAGGFLVWQDNITDGDGWGISAVRLDGNFSGEYGNFRVNQQGAGDQENPQVALLNGGGAVFVWQGGSSGQQHIYARFLSSANIWQGGDVMANTPTNFYQQDPAVTVLTNGTVIVAWSSMNQDGSLLGVYAQAFSPAGAKMGSEFAVNQATTFNQRNPAIAALSSGGFVLAWVSEQERFSQAANGFASVDVYARIYNAGATPVGNEFLVNTSTNLSANPSVAAMADGSFAVAWSQFDKANPQNSWDIYLRPFSAAGAGGLVTLANTQQYGDQYVPHIAAVGSDYLVVWTSLGQDGSYEGVYGQFCHNDGTHTGGEFRVNTTTLYQQEYPAVAADSAGQALVVWSSLNGPVYGMDIDAQRFANSAQALVAPAAPFVTPISSSRLSVTWPPVSGLSVTNYDLYVDGSVTPTVVYSNLWAMIDLAPGSTHTFRLDFVLTDGRRSPQSDVATGTTWGEDNNSDGLPDDWQALYWGPNPAKWPAPGTLLAPGGPTVLQAFLSGSNPLDPSTWFKAKTITTPEGVFLTWSTVAGGIYQVISSPGLPPNWIDLGAPRFAAGTNDSIYLGPSFNGFYKISRLRY